MKRIASISGANGEKQGDAFKLAPFNPSSDQIQEKATSMFDLGEHDVLFDIGCGDGRLLCFAATKIPGLKCVGIEILEEFVSRARERVKECNLESRIDIRLEDATKLVETSTAEIGKGIKANDEGEKCLSDLTLLDDATALYLFILPKGIVKIMPILQSLKEKRNDEGKRLKVLSYMFKIHDWEATKTDVSGKGGCPVYYYDFQP
ncbi:unnamed protein product [Pseudo-nitzschia multistriata]|uniref:Methyltransferase domain-containing protein n=1 Tax=Pseudo-nitzschia multistriata TaxID=183589 RepID=A0A448ZKU1_9STRA|nr:unnamed protein product [Pseudo-nitzschia multistriata]